MYQLFAFLGCLILISIVLWIVHLYHEISEWRDGCEYHSERHGYYQRQVFLIQQTMRECPRCSRKIK